MDVPPTSNAELDPLFGNIDVLDRNCSRLARHCGSFNSPGFLFTFKRFHHTSYSSLRAHSLLSHSHYWQVSNISYYTFHKKIIISTNGIHLLSKRRDKRTGEGGEGRGGAAASRHHNGHLNIHGQIGSGHSREKAGGGPD